MLKKFVILFATLLVVVSVFGSAYADKSKMKDKADKGGDGGGDSGDSVQGLDAGGDKMKDKADNGGDGGGDSGDSVQGLDAGGDKMKDKADKGGNGQGKGLGKPGDITVGELIQTTEKVKKEQWKITRDQLKALGYHGPVSDFVTAFNREINAQKAEIKEKILNGSTELSQAVINETAERELARIRDEEISNLNITDSGVVSSLTDLLGDERTIDGDLADALKNEINFMDTHFKKSIFHIATNGTDVEKRNLTDQLNRKISNFRRGENVANKPSP